MRWSARPCGSAALAAERAAVPGRAVSAVNLPGVLAPGRAGVACFPGTLALQCLAELGLRLVCGGGLVPPARTVTGLCLAGGTCPVRGTWLLLAARHVAGTFRPCRLVGHGGLLPWGRAPCAGPAVGPSRRPALVPAIQQNSHAHPAQRS